MTAATRGRAPTRVKVRALDLAPVAKEATGTLKADPEKYGIKLEGDQVDFRAKVGLRWGVVETPKGVYVLCNEGVGIGEPLQGDDTFSVDVHVDYLNAEGKVSAFSMFPVAKTEMTVDKLLAHRSDEEVPLDEFIRTFGARLEQNYSAWRKTLEGALA